MTGVSGPGNWPGLDVLGAQLRQFEDFAAVPFGVDPHPTFVQLGERGPGADRLGRTLALLGDLPTELGPHGWRLAAHGGVDLRRAQSFLAQDLEALSIAGAGYSGALSVHLVGPWTLAAQVYLAHKDKIVSDQGAVRDLAQGLGEAAAAHVRAIKERVPGARVTVQFDETLLGQVGAGVLPTFSGHARIRSVPGPVLVERLETVLSGLKSGGVETVVHVGQTRAAIAPVVLAGATGFGLEFGPEPAWDERGWELIARAIERGLVLWPGLAPVQVSSCSGANLQKVSDTVTLGWGRIGLPARDLDSLVLTHSREGARAGYGGTEQQARGAVLVLIKSAEHLAEKANT